MAAERAPVLVRHAGGGGGAVEALRQLPPGFRFRPTDQELVVQYLRRKALGVPLPAAVIPVARDLYGLDPWDVVVPAGPDASSEGEKYFFAVRPAGGGGASRATASGRWKPAGKEKPVVLPRPCGGGSLLVGVKRAMTFVPRRKKKASSSSSSPASAALATGWVMHEYRLAAPLHKNGCSLAQAQGEWVVCRVFQKGSSRPRRRRPVPLPAAAAAASPSPSPSPSSASSCVTDGSNSDLDEVSS